LERALTGTATIRDTPFNPNDPIVSDGGIAVSGATVTIVTSSGQLIGGTEDRQLSQNGTGAGVYRFPLSGSALVPGQRYRLQVRTPQGEELSATTTIPDTRTTPLLTVQSFNRDRDT